MAPRDDIPVRKPDLGVVPGAAAPSRPRRGIGLRFRASPGPLGPYNPLTDGCAACTIAIALFPPGISPRAERPRRSWRPGVFSWFVEVRPRSSWSRARMTPAWRNGSRSLVRRGVIDSLPNRPLPPARCGPEVAVSLGGASDLASVPDGMGPDAAGRCRTLFDGRSSAVYDPLRSVPPPGFVESSDFLPLLAPRGFFRALARKGSRRGRPRPRSGCRGPTAPFFRTETEGAGRLGLPKTGPP